MTNAQPQKNYELFQQELVDGNPSELRLHQIVRQLKADRRASPNDDRLIEILGIALIRLKKYDDAIRALNIAYKMDRCPPYANNLILSYCESKQYNNALTFNLENMDYLSDFLAVPAILANNYSADVLELIREQDRRVIDIVIESGLCEQLTNIFRHVVEETGHGSQYTFNAEIEEGEWVVDINASIIGDTERAMNISKKISDILVREYDSEVLMKIVPTIDLFELEAA